MIPVSALVLGDLEERLVVEALRSGQLAQGRMVERFEAAVRDVVGVHDAIAVNSGTSALVAALLGHGIGPGDEVVTTPLTFVATLNAILGVGATVRFADVGDDGNIDAALVGEALRPRTRAVLPVHLYGRPADMRRIAAAVAGREVAIVEDAAQALGATRDGRAAGSFGTGCFSFYATKNVTTGEGGVVTTDDAAVAGTVRLVRDQGQRARYDYARAGLNLRMTELQGALGVAQMTRLTEVVRVRRANAAVLRAGLAGLEGLVTPPVPPGHVFHQFTVRITPAARRDRDAFAAYLRARGVGCAVHYPRPVYDYDCFRHEPRIARPATPNACRLAAEVVSLPVHPRLSAADLGRITEVSRQALA